MPKDYHYNYQFPHVPPVMRRGTHALAVLMDSRGNYLLGGKDIYPPGIYRLIGGGVNTTEEPLAGLLRELEEETGFTPTTSKVKKLANIIAKTQDNRRRTYNFHVHLFHLTVDPKKLTPRSDLDEIKLLNASGFKALINLYHHLSPDLVHLSKIPGTEFRWSDYGTFFGQVHQIAYDLTQTK